MLKEFKSLVELLTYFDTEDKCREYFSYVRWEDNIICPKCGCNSFYDITTQKRYKCSKCKTQFNEKTDTIFENTKISMKKWFIAIYLMTNHKKGISSCELARQIGVTQKTAWKMEDKIRTIISTNEEQTQLENVVEVDETYIGGKEKNKHRIKRTKGTQGRSTKTKTAVLGMIERNGNLVLKELKQTNTLSINKEIQNYIKEDSTIFTDEALFYTRLNYKYNHNKVIHSKGEYVNENVYTNTIEGVFSLLKRQILGIHHWISKKHISKYLSIFSFKHNNRSNMGLIFNSVLNKVVC